MPLTFDPETHTYRDHGRVVPGVSAIRDAAGLGPDYAMVPEELLATAAALGRLVHDVVERMDTQDLWPEEAPPEVRGYADAYLRFRIEGEYRPIRCEIPLISAQWGYAGTADKVGFLRARRTLIDVKTPRVVDRPATTIQLEAYRGLGYHRLQAFDIPARPADAQRGRCARLRIRYLVRLAWARKSA